MAIQSTAALADAGAAVSSTALTLLNLGFTQAQIDAADRAWITCSGNDIRYRYTGSVPTASNGHLLAVGVGTEIIDNRNIRNLQFIRATGTDGAVWVTLESWGL